MNAIDLVCEGEELLTISDVAELRSRYLLWCKKLKRFMIQSFDEGDQKLLDTLIHYTDNEYSDEDTRNSLKKAINETILFLDGKESIPEPELSKPMGLALIEKMLNNFGLFYRALCENPIHKRGTLSQETLDGIMIGNEYDLQRLVYSVLVPVFPEIRQEVDSDNGYGGMRADLFLRDYDLIIELKCTRESMTEKRLLEELAADGYLYQASIIYFFVYDKADIIKNHSAFRSALGREKREVGKMIRVVVLPAV